MTNEEALDVVLEAAERAAEFNPQHDKIKEAVYQMQDYRNDVMEN